MVAAILLGLLFIIVLSFVIVFVFHVLSPSLRRQNVPFERTLVSEGEIRIKPSQVELYAPQNGKRAAVFCSPEKNCVRKQFDYSGPKSCALFHSLYDSERDCTWSCIGFGDCVRSCTRGALSVENETAVVNGLCNGCGKCIDSCPKSIIKLVPSESGSLVLCSAQFSEATECPAFLAEADSSPKKAKRGFQIWKMCYKLFHKDI